MANRNSERIQTNTYFNNLNNLSDYERRLRATPVKKKMRIDDLMAIVRSKTSDEAVIEKCHNYILTYPRIALNVAYAQLNQIIEQSIANCNKEARNEEAEIAVPFENKVTEVNLDDLYSQMNAVVEEAKLEEEIKTDYNTSEQPQE
jgi:hypothetical protein